MQVQEPQIPIPNHKTFNMFTSTIIKNYIPSSIQMFKLQTHHDLLLNNTLHRYVTNIILASQRWIKVYVMFQHNQIHQIFETEVNETIRSIHQIQKSILIEVEHKLICVSYEPGNFKTVGMMSLQFIRLRYGYESIIRVDNTKKYILMVAGDYLLFITNSKCKELGMIHDCPLFEKALDEVKWSHPDHNYFNAIIHVKIVKPFFKALIDVQFDKSNVYFLVRQNSVSSIHVISFENVKPDTTIDTLFIMRFTNLPPLCYKLAILNPDINSTFLIFSSQNVYHLALWQQQSIGKYQLPKDTDFSTLKVRPFNPSHIYYQDNTGIHVLKILNSGQIQITKVNSTITSDFCMTTVSINGCLAYLSNGKCTVEIFEGNICIYSWLNSILDFYVGKNLILALEYQDPVYKNNKESNRVIAIRRNFKCVDKVSSHPKKIFIESLLPAEISNIGNTRYLLVKSNNNKKTIFKDAETITPITLDNIVDAFEVKPLDQKQESCIGVYFQNGSLSLFSFPNFERIWDIENIFGKIVNINNELFCIQNSGILTIVNLHNKFVSNFQHSLPQQTIKCYISKQNISFAKRIFNDEKFDSISKYLLYVCTPITFQIYTLRPQTNHITLSWSTPKIGSGLAVLNNNLDRHRINKQFQEYRSISDSHYIITNLVPPSAETHLKYTVIDFKYAELPSQTIILFLASNNQFYLYKKTISENSIGLLFKRVILPLYQSKINDFSITQVTPQILKFGTRVLYDDVILEISQPIKQCFNLGGELWIMGNDNKLRLADIKGNRISGKLVYTVGENNSYHALDNTPEYYVLFTRDSIELYDKELIFRSKIALRSSGSNNIGSQQMITAKASQSICAISSCQHFKSATENFQSYKFVFFVYDLKDKLRSDALFFEQPVVSIKFGKPGRIAFSTSSNFFVYEVKQNKLEVVKTVFYTVRPYLGGFAYWRDMKPNTTNSYHFMVFGGSIDGLSFAGFDDEKLIFQEKWFQPLKFGTRDIEIFGYGTSFKALIADNHKNVVVMDLNNESTSKLYDFHLGTLVNKLTKVQDSSKLNELVYCCCADGTIRVFTAIKRQQNISLRKFQKLILDQLPTFGGLALERKIRQEMRSYKVNCKGNIIESGTLELFNNLSQEIRESIIEKSQYEQQQIQNTIFKNCVF